MRSLIALPAVAALIALAGCAGAPNAPERQVAEYPESECLVAVDSSNCKFKNDLAGGAPVVLTQEP